MKFKSYVGSITRLINVLSIPISIFADWHHKKLTFKYPATSLLK